MIIFSSALFSPLCSNAAKWLAALPVPQLRHERLSTLGGAFPLATSPKVGDALDEGFVVARTRSIDTSQCWCGGYDPSYASLDENRVL
ncbi:hypothetical protein E2C01_047963 [Portunus trituberculatus]|uniref:Uncharacterized protein n=1 Tax=Portunus trituberculatus TaxID=210409 RepID=A0A5B7G9A4_PORTR|nr:hypothetical protein [Portunus trituberculatus]